MKLLCLLGFSLTVFAAEPIQFKSHGKDLKRLILTEKLKAREIRIFDVHEEKQVLYLGFDFNEVMKEVYGNDWQKSEEVLFTCADGFQPSVTTSRFLKDKAYLVYERVGSEFVIHNKSQNEKQVPLGPYYVVWDTLKSPHLKTAGFEAWPYQVVGVDLVTFAERFPYMSPPKKASAKESAGFLAYRAHCMSCHTVNGEGGKKGPELNYPTSVTEYISEKWLKKWIQDPRSIRFNTTMPAFIGSAEELDSIHAYLKVMAKHKKIQK